MRSAELTVSDRTAAAPRSASAASFCTNGNTELPRVMPGAPSIRPIVPGRMHSISSTSCSESPRTTAVEHAPVVAAASTVCEGADNESISSSSPTSSCS